jgi:sulfite exporter TauE/SafE
MPIDTLVIGAAFLSGLLGGVHCVAMCGGIATAFPCRTLGSALQPNLGRIAGYTVAGTVAGGLGHGVVGLFRSPVLGQSLRAVVGLVLVWAALRMLGLVRGLGTQALPGPLGPVLRALRQRLLPLDTGVRRFMAGLLWGWLPCGLSATLLSAAWLQADPLAGGLTMFAFGIGTLPVMLPLTWSGSRWVSQFQRGGGRTAAGVLVLLAGLLTLAAPWLTHAPGVHRVLVALGCASAQP